MRQQWGENVVYRAWAWTSRSLFVRLGTAAALLTMWSAPSIVHAMTGETRAGVSAVSLPASQAPDLLSTSDSGTSDSDNITNMSTPTVSVSGVGVGSSVEITATQQSTTVSCTFNAMSTTGECTLSTLGEGDWVLTSFYTDANSDTSATSPSGTVTVDITAPSSPSAPDVAATSDTGSSDTDNNTGDTTPEVSSAGAQTGEIVRVTATKSGTSQSCTYVFGTSSSCDLPTLSDGNWVVKAEVIDVAGNVSNASPATKVKIDASLGAPTSSSSSSTSSSSSSSTTSTTEPASSSTTMQTNSQVVTTSLPQVTTSSPSSDAVQTLTNPTTTTSTSTTTTTLKTTTTSTSTLPNPLIPFENTSASKTADGNGAVVGMPAGGWVKTQTTGQLVSVTTSEDLSISIGALAALDETAVFNDRGMLTVGQGSTITVGGSGFQPETPASTWLFSTPTRLGEIVVDSQGKFVETYTVPAEISAGDHTAQINGIAPDGTLRSVELKVEVTADQTQQINGAATSAGQGSAVLSTASANGQVPTDPLADRQGAVNLIASGLVLLAAAQRSGNMGSSSASSTASEEDEEERGEVGEVSAAKGVQATLDHPNRLRTPQIRVVNSFMHALAERVDHLFPMFARSVDDGAYARSLFGIFWPIFPVVGAVLAVVSAINTDFEVLMPSLGILLAVLIVGIFDSFAGIAFTVVYGIAVLVGGGFHSFESVRGFLGIAVFAFGPPLIASSIRPFRRVNKGTLDVWNRAVDVVLLALMGAWATGGLFSSLPTLTGYTPTYSQRADLIHVVALIALVVRWLLENAARILTPQQLREIELEEFGSVSVFQNYASIFLRTAMFVMVAESFIGMNWALWVGGAMFVVPKVVGLYLDALPNVSVLHRYVPRGLFRTVVMMFVATWWGTLVNEKVTDPKDMILVAFVFMGIPGQVLGIIDWFGRESKGWQSTVPSRVLGCVTFVVGFLIVRGVIRL